MIADHMQGIEQFESELWRITTDVKKLVAANVYAHVWEQAVNGSFARAA